MGSLVIVDSESVTRYVFEDSTRRLAGEFPGNGPAITRPYSDFWLSHQNLDADRELVGLESKTFIDEGVNYARLLLWGVVLHRSQQRIIQTFGFPGTRLLPEHKISVPLADEALTMPVAIGDVQPEGRLKLTGIAIDTLRRTRSIDVVYPVAGSKEKTKSSKVTDKRAALPKLRTNQT